MIDTVLFDLDSTLVDDGPNWRRSVAGTMERLCQEHGGLDRERLEKAYYAVAGAVWEEMRGTGAAPWGNMDDAGIVRRVWGEALAQVGLRVEHGLDEVVEGYLRLRRGPVAAYDDVRPCLDMLAPRYRLGVVTNAAAAQQMPKIEAAGLAAYFEVVVTTDCGYGKPDPAIFALALEQLDAAAERAVYVGDSLGWDVAGAKRAGMTAVWLNRHGTERGKDDPVPDAQIDSLDRLPEVLEA